LSNHDWNGKSGKGLGFFASVKRSREVMENKDGVELRNLSARIQMWVMVQTKTDNFFFREEQSTSSYLI
jgi:hypothetical protein